jgi:hypothetical protein
MLEVNLNNLRRVAAVGQARRLKRYGSNRDALAPLADSLPALALTLAQVVDASCQPGSLAKAGSVGLSRKVIVSPTVSALHFRTGTCQPLRVGFVLNRFRECCRRAAIYAPLGKPIRDPMRVCAP